LNPGPCTWLDKHSMWSLILPGHFSTATASKYLQVTLGPWSYPSQGLCLCLLSPSGGLLLSPGPQVTHLPSLWGVLASLCTLLCGSLLPAPANFYSLHFLLFLSEAYPEDACMKAEILDCLCLIMFLVNSSITLPFGQIRHSTVTITSRGSKRHFTSCF
jgi:hypothetical protein